jgi:phosphate-selective porin OprO/OprP
LEECVFKIQEGKCISKVGNQIPRFGLEDTDGSNFIKLPERSLANSLTPPGFFLGGQVNAWGNNWTASAGAFIDRMTDRGEPNSNVGEGNVETRLTFAPILNKQQTLHFGVSGSYRKIDDDKPYSISPRPEVGITNTRLIRTGNIDDVDDTVAYDIEAAYAQGPLLLQGEYIQRDVNRDSLSDFDFDGWYLQGAWVITGERQRYSKKSGKFRGIRPKGKYGAVELAARFTALDLSDGNLSQAGEQDNTSIGLNWYLNRNIRLMATYIWMDVDSNQSNADEEPEAFLARLQIAF